jgi:hypothetical protein
MHIFGQLLLVDKQKVPYLHKTTSKEFEFLHKSYATAIAMATMTFQDGGYFGFNSLSTSDILTILRFHFYNVNISARIPPFKTKNTIEILIK